MRSKIDLSAGLARFIDRDDIVVRAAKLIDPAAFQEWFSGTGATSKPVPPGTRKKCAQSRAICLALDVLKLASQQADLKKQLADSEAANWEFIGVPANDPELRPIIDAKYL